MLRELADSTNLCYGRAEYMGEIMAVDKTVLELVQSTARTADTATASLHEASSFILSTDQNASYSF